MAQIIQDSSFEEEVIKSDIPVLLDFYADWCGPCRMVSPILEELSGEYTGKAKICKINIDENQETTSKYGVLSIPTMILFKDGEVVEQVVGAKSKEELKNLLDKNT